MAHMSNFVKPLCFQQKHGSDEAKILSECNHVFAGNIGETANNAHEQPPHQRNSKKRKRKSKNQRNTGMGARETTATEQKTATKTRVEPARLF
jgi:hypothetical protein